MYLLHRGLFHCYVYSYVLMVKPEKEYFIWGWNTEKTRGKLKTIFKKWDLQCKNRTQPYQCKTNCTSHIYMSRELCRRVSPKWWIMMGFQGVLLLLLWLYFYMNCFSKFCEEKKQTEDFDQDHSLVSKLSRSLRSMAYV